MSDWANLKIKDRFNNSTIQQFNDSTFQHFNDSTVQHFNITSGGTLKRLFFIIFCLLSISNIPAQRQQIYICNIDGEVDLG